MSNEAKIVSSLRLLGVAGANKIMAGELSRLVRRRHDDVRVPIPDKQGPGALCYPFDPRMASVAVGYHRTSARVLWELYRCPATRLEPLYAQLCDAIARDVRTWFWDGATLSVSAFSVRDFAAGERQVVGTVKNAVVEAAAARGAHLRVDPEHPDLVIDVRVVEGQVSVALDLAGMPMHRRGYRHKSGVAPLREDLAAMLVMLARHDSRSELLVDPMAGSATIGIEAVGLGQGRFNWCSGRAPVCSSWPTPSTWSSNQPKAIFGDTQPACLLNEADPETFAIAQRNVETAGCTSNIDLRLGDLRDVDSSTVAAVAQQRGLDPSRGVIVCNPPYGHRLSDPVEVEGLYRELGAWTQQFRGWRAAFLVAHDAFEQAMGQRARIKKPIHNGPLDAMFMLFDL